MVDKLFKYLLVFCYFFGIQSLEATTNTNTDASFKINFNKAWQFRNINNDSTIYYATKALTISNNAKINTKKIDLYTVLILSYIQKGDYTSAIEKAQQAQKLIDYFNLKEKEAKLLMWTGNIYQSMGFSSKALEYLFKAAKSKPNNSIKKEILYHTALVYYSLNEIEQCRNKAHQSISIQSDKNNLENSVNAFILLSNIYNSFDSINFYLNKAYNIVKDDPEMEYKKVVVLNNQALLYDMVGKIKLRNKKYLEAINIAKYRHFTSFLTELYNNYSYVL
ncbi:MAG: hypothetical protein DRJ09_11215, partial [Bacteroidetes bacterium]